MRQCDRQREEVSRCDSLFTPMTDVFLPPQYSSGLQRLNLSRVIWPDHCENLEYSSGSVFALGAETLQGSHFILTFYTELWWILYMLWEDVDGYIFSRK